MHRIMVAGIGTNVGKTIVSAILTLIFQGEYWKPIQCGDEQNSDTNQIKKLLNNCHHLIHNSAYSFSAPLSPHHAANLENTSIQIETITPPLASRPLIIEGVGGIFVPLTKKILTIDLFATWNCHWVIVSKHYLGSINHTLLTIEALKQRQIPILGLIFNGNPNEETESAILEISKIPLLGRLMPEFEIDLKTLQKYLIQWKPNFSTHLP